LLVVVVVVERSLVVVVVVERSVDVLFGLFAELRLRKPGAVELRICTTKCQQKYQANKM